MPSPKLQRGFSKVLALSCLCSAATNTPVTQFSSLQVVFVNAIAALPGSLDFRAGLLRALRPFHSRLSGAPGIWQAVLASIAHDFADSERAHDLLAREAAWAAEPDTALQVGAGLACMDFAVAAVVLCNG